jgi:7-cyano-7-deazaguanine reductase
MLANDSNEYDNPSPLRIVSTEFSRWTLRVRRIPFVSFATFCKPLPADMMPEPTRDALDTFDNPYPDRDYSIETVCPEFTSLCPKTGQPDFGTLTITYVPDRLCFELKSLKLYLQQFRNHGAFYEAVTNRILDDLVAVTRPRRMQITAAFTPRGGIRTNVIVDYLQPRTR